MWRFVFRPEILLLFGAIQAMVPFIVWHFRGTNPLYAYEVSYEPVVVWVVGVVAFWIGTLLYRHRRSHGSIRIVHPWRFRWFTIAMIAFLLVQLAGLVAVYGGLPLLGYLQETTNVWQADVALEGSFLGQMGIFVISVYVVNALLLILVISGHQERGSRRRRFLLLFIALINVVAALHGGKRQIIAIMIVYLACGAAIALRHPVRPFLHYLGFPAEKTMARASLLLIPAVFIALIGYFTQIRTGRDMSGLQEVTRYLEFPIMNLGRQIEVIGYSPEEREPIRLLRNYVPHRFLQRFPALSEMPPRVEPTASAGFWGDLHWSVGIEGIIVFSLIVGFICKYFYSRAHDSLPHLLVYSQIVWTLFASHSYNHFLYLMFIVAPGVVLWLVAMIDRDPGLLPLAERPPAGAQRR